MSLGMSIVKNIVKTSFDTRYFWMSFGFQDFTFKTSGNSQFIVWLHLYFAFLSIDTYEFCLTEIPADLIKNFAKAILLDTFK